MTDDDLNVDVFLGQGRAAAKRVPAGLPKADYFRTTEGGHVVAFAGTPGGGLPVGGHPAVLAKLTGGTAAPGVSSSGGPKVPKTQKELDALSLKASQTTYEEGGPIGDLDAVVTGKNGVVTTKLIDQSRGEAGTVVASFSIGKDGRPEAYHDWVVLKPQHQGKGVSKELARRQDEMYSAMGVSNVKLQANLNVGGYTWALHGYDFDSAEEKRVVVNNIAHHMALLDKGSYGANVDRHKTQLVAKAASMHSWDLARLKYKGSSVGKDGMIGTAWHGTRSMDPKSMSFKVGAAYYQGKSKG